RFVGMREAEVAVHDLCVRRLLRAIERRELVAAVIGHLRDSHVRLGFRSRKRPGGGVRTRQEVEERRLADVGQPRGGRNDAHAWSRVSSTFGGASWKTARPTRRTRSTEPVRKTLCPARPPSRT